MRFAAPSSLAATQQVPLAFQATQKTRASALRRRRQPATMASAVAPGEALKPVRSLHWVFKIADRHASMEFYRDTLGMTVLRHEEVSPRASAAPASPSAARRFTLPAPAAAVQRGLRRLLQWPLRWWAPDQPAAALAVA